MKKASPFICGTVILTLSNFFSRLIGFYNRIFLAGVIGAHQIGIYQLIFPVYLLGFVDRKHQTDYGIYFLLTIIATVLVVILVCVGVMHNTMLVTVTTGIGVLLLLAKIIFQGKTFLSELSRRLHV